jgi:hypothetical protein
MRSITMMFSTVALAMAFSACAVNEDLTGTDPVGSDLALEDEPTLGEVSQDLQQTEGASDEGLSIPDDPGAGILAPCGASLRGCTGVTCVDYRHCTSGSDSIRVRAIIHLGADGPCTTVGPNQTKLIWTYGGFSFFDRIDRC